MITQAELQQILHYDPLTGLFTWIKKIARCINVGSVAGSLKPNGYIEIMINRTSYGAHRLAWLYVHGSFPPEFIDHANNIRNDNSLANLRKATRAQNAINSKISSKNTSGYKGVSWNKNGKKWQATIRINKKKIYLGSFDTAKKASKVYNAAAIKNHKEFVRL